MQKLTNVRPLLFLFFILCFGIYSAYAFLFEMTPVIIVAILFLISLILLIILTFLKNKPKFLKVFLKRGFLIVSVIIYALSFGLFLMQVNAFETTKLNGQEYAVTARISEKILWQDNHLELFLENASVVREGLTTKLSKQIKLSIYFDDAFDESQIKTGNFAVFSAKLIDYNLIQKNKLNTYVYNNQLGYYGVIDSSQMVVFNGNVKLDEMLRLNIKSMLDRELSYDTANLAYAALFGDKTLIESLTYDNYAKSGIAHVLSVSGLHVGFLVAVLLFIFNEAKINRKIQFILLLVILISYSYLCGFSPSVLRASIMAVTLLLGTLLGERSDNLSSLSLAGIILLLFRPLDLFTAGFLLSFLSVFGIFLFYNTFNKAFLTIKLPSVVANPISLTLSAQIATLPIVASLFGNVNLLSIVTNLITLPLFTIGYLFLFVAVIFTSFLNLFSFLFFVPELMFLLVSLFAKIVSQFDFLIFSLQNFNLLETLGYLILLFFISPFTLLKINKKAFMSGVLSVMLVVNFIVATVPTVYAYDSVTVIDGVSSASVVTTTENKNYLVDVGNGDSSDEYYIKTYLKEKKISKLEAIIVTSYNEEKQEIVSKLAKEYGVNSVLISYNNNNILLYSLSVKLPANTQIILLENEVLTTYKNIAVTSYIIGEVGHSITFKTTNLNLLFADSKLNTEELNAIKNVITADVDVFILDKFTTNLHVILSENPVFYEINTIIARNSLLDYELENLFLTSLEGHLRVK